MGFFARLIEARSKWLNTKTNMYNLGYKNNKTK